MNTLRIIALASMMSMSLVGCSLLGGPEGGPASPSESVSTMPSGAPSDVASTLPSESVPMASEAVEVAPSASTTP